MTNDKAWGTKEQIDSMFDLLSNMEDIVISMEKRSENCGLHGISKEIFDFERWLGTYIFTGMIKGKGESLNIPKVMQNKMNEIKTRYDTAIYNIDKNCVCIPKR